jgi:hypothetical protein
MNYIPIFTIIQRIILLALLLTLVGSFGLVKEVDGKLSRAKSEKSFFESIVDYFSIFSYCCPSAFLFHKTQRKH